MEVLYITSNYGNAEGAGCYVSPGGMTTIDSILENVGTSTAQRFLQGTVGNDGGMSLGWGTKEINTSFGRLQPKVDIFLAREYEARGVPKVASPANPEVQIEGKTSSRAPDTPGISVATNAGPTANSQWIGSGTRPSGATYQYRVAAGNRFGLSAAAAAADAGGDVVAAGDNTITITPAGSSQYPATFYEIYSEQAEGDGNFLFCGRIADSGAATTDFVDLNAIIPGTTRMFILDFTSVGEMRTCSLKRLAPVHSKECFLKNGQASCNLLLRTINTTLYTGDSDLIPESIDGFQKIIDNNGSTDHTIDLRGAVPTQATFRSVAELITANFGNAEGAGLYCSPGGMTTLDSVLENVGTSTAQRFLQGNVGSDGKMSLGWGTDRINTSFGRLIPKVDIFLAREYEARGVPKIPSPANPEVQIEGKTSSRAPDAPGIVISNTTPGTPSKFQVGDPRPSGGDYAYRVAAGNRFGLSPAAASATGGGAVAAGDQKVVTITPAGSSQYPATYYEIYSEATAGDGNHLFIGRIADSGAATTVFNDNNDVIPGTTRMFILDFTSVGEMRAYMLKRLAPVHSKEYA